MHVRVRESVPLTDLTAAIMLMITKSSVVGRIADRTDCQ